MSSDFDHEMIGLAKRRGQVKVTRGERTSLATLIAWRPHRNGKRTNTARVLFASGRYASVKLEEVEVPNGVH